MVKSNFLASGRLLDIKEFKLSWKFIEKSRIADCILLEPESFSKFKAMSKADLAIFCSISKKIPLKVLVATLFNLFIDAPTPETRSVFSKSSAISLNWSIVIELNLLIAALYSESNSGLVLFMPRFSSKLVTSLSGDVNSFVSEDAFFWSSLNSLDAVPLKATAFWISLE